MSLLMSALALMLEIPAKIFSSRIELARSSELVLTVSHSNIILVLDNLDANIHVPNCRETATEPTIGFDFGHDTAAVTITANSEQIVSVSSMVANSDCDDQFVITDPHFSASSIHDGFSARTTCYFLAFGVDTAVSFAVTGSSEDTLAVEGPDMQHARNGSRAGHWQFATGQVVWRTVAGEAAKRLAMSGDAFEDERPVVIDSKISSDRRHSLRRLETTRKGQREPVSIGEMSLTAVLVAFSVCIVVSVYRDGRLHGMQ